MEPTPDREEEMATAAEELTWAPAYSIEETDDEILVRIPRGVTSVPQIRRYLALMMLDSVRQKSQLSEEDANELAEEAARTIWDQNRHRVREAE